MIDDPLKAKKSRRGLHPNSLANLIKYPPGVSGNAGSGKGYSLTAALKHALAKDASLRDKIISSTIEGAILRETAPFKEVWDRIDGKVSGDLPPVSQDNRVLNIFVIDGETKELITQVKERTGKLIEGVKDA